MLNVPVHRSPLLGIVRCSVLGQCLSFQGPLLRWTDGVPLQSSASSAGSLDREGRLEGAKPGTK